MTRGILNRNPCNIRLGDHWLGLAKTQDDAAFCIFTAPEYGLRAALIILHGYMTKGFDTVEEIINRWAPPSENNTSAYVADVCKRVGVSPLEVVPNTQESMTKLLKALVWHENGEQPYADDIFDLAWKLYRG